MMTSRPPPRRRLAPHPRRPCAGCAAAPPLRPRRAPAPAPTTVATATPARTAPLPPAPPAPAPVAAAPAPRRRRSPRRVPVPNSPLGVWQTEENKGNVRIEPCGANLCGYAVNTGETHPDQHEAEGSKWTGRIHDPDSGRNYDSTIAMKGPNILKVQGCAFGGMFCGGQTWKRIS